MPLTASHRSFARCLLGLGLGAALAGSAQAWAWSTAAPLPQDTSRPAALSVPDAQGFWQLGRGLVHYAADGHADVVRDADIADSALSVALPNGGVLFSNGLHDIYTDFSSTLPAPCVLRAYTGQGAPRWQDTADDGGFCQRVGLDNAGVLWVKTTDMLGPVLRYALDGAELAPLPGAFADFALRGDGVYALGSVTPGRLVAVDHNGAVQWTWTDADATHAYRRVVRGDDGNLYAAGFVGAAATPGGGALQVSSVDTSGKARWSIQVAGVQASQIAALAPSGDGALYVVAVNGPGSTAGVQLVRIGNDGSVAWNHALDGAQACNAYDTAACSFAVAPGGDALVAASIGSGNERVYRYDSAGTQHYAQDVAGSVTAQRALANGDALIALRQADPVALSALRLAPDGTTATPPAAVAIDALPQASHGNVAADGSTYLLTVIAGATSLTKIDANGSVAWQQGVSGGDRVSAFGGSVCVVSDQALGCYAAADGAPLWNAALDSSNGTTPVRVLADGGVEVVERHPAGGATQRVFNADGTTRLRADLPGSVGAQIAATGTVYVFNATFRNLYAYDSGGNPVYDAAVPQALTPVFPSQQPALTLGTDGSAVVTLNKEDPSNSTPAAWLVSPQGATVWQLTLQDAQPAFPNGVYVQIASRIGIDGTVYFALSNPLPNAPTLTYTVNVEAIAPTAQRLWLASQVLQTPGNVALLQDVVTRNVLVLGPAPDRLIRAALDSTGGNTVGYTVEACPAEAPPAGARFAGDACTWQDFGLTPDGTLHATAMVQSETARSGPVAFARGNAPARFGALTLLPAGFDGAWYAPYEPGQGFLFDEVNGVQILSWFTFAPGADNANDPAHLAWYTAQASCCVPGQTFYSSGIYQSQPGTFASGTAPAQQVGTLRVYYTDCDDALLTYTFTPGPSGSIALKRLTPSTTGCGNGAPAEIGGTPTNGFDTSQSGSWFDPQESGQGFDFVVLPGGGGFGGLVYGAWFTFDPAGAANDTGHLQWFTLQGDLSQASGGSVQMPILQTLGGTFDGAPTANTNVVGQATLTFTACDHASLSYSFDNSPVAHAFAGLSGVSNLVKIGGCAANSR